MLFLSRGHFFNGISNACCESIFATFRRKEKEGYHFSSLMVRSVAVFNKTIDWLRVHPNRGPYISQALRFVPYRLYDIDHVFMSC